MESLVIHRVLIAHQHPPLAGLIGARLAAEPGLFVCGTAYTGATLRIFMQSLQPDVLILDAHFDGQNLAALCQPLQLTHPQLRVIVLTAGAPVEDLGSVFAALIAIPSTGIATRLLPAFREIVERPTSRAAAIPAIGLGRPPR